MMAHQNTWGRVSQAWKRVWKRDDKIPNFQYKHYLAWMLVGVQMNHGIWSMHAQWFSHQNDGAADHDIIK